MDIKDSYLHGTVGVVKSISVTADKLSYKLADVAGTTKTVTMPTATQSANGLLSKEDKIKLDNMVATKVANDLTLKINSGTTEGTSLYTYNGSSAKTLDIKSGTGIGFTNNAGSLQIYNSGVRSIATGTTNGTISVNTNGTSANVAVKGLGSAAYTASTNYAVRKTLTDEDLNDVITPGFYNAGGGNTVTNKPSDVAHFGLEVIHGAVGSYYVQILYQNSYSNSVWRRHCQNGTWSDWTLDKLTDTTYSVVSSSANGLAPKVISTNTATVGSAYYVLASTNGSATPSWYKLPATAFANDDTKVTQTNTTGSAYYRVLLSGRDNDTTETTNARKSSKLLFNPSTGNLINKGDITIDCTGESDKFLNFTTSTTHSWRLGHLASGNGNANYFVIQSSKDTENTWTDVLRLGLINLEATFASTVIAPTFQGNLDGTYVNKLTGYYKATSAADLAATDTLNVALGKLEYKADTVYDWYKGVTGTDNDDIINKWEEIVNFIDSVKEGTDITDEFVTRKTAQTITGLKTFNSNIIMGTSHYIYGISEGGGAMLFFDGTRTILGSVGETSTSNTHIRSKDAIITVGTSNNGDYTILHSGNYTLYVNSTNFPGLAGVRSVTINGDYLRVNTNGTNADLTIPYSLGSHRLLSSGSMSEIALWGLPKYSYTSLNNEFGTTGSDTVTYLKNYIKKIMKSHSSYSAKTGIGTITPNSALISLFRAYNYDDYNSTGLPLYSVGMSVDINGRVRTWGTNNGLWHYRELAFTTEIPTSLKNPYTLTFSAGTFAVKTYDGSAAVTVNVPTKTSHLTNDSGYLTQHLSLANYVTLNTAQTITGEKTFTNKITIKTTSANKTPKVVFDEYYNSSNPSWISEIASDYYGANICETTGFTHGFYITLGRSGFDNLIILNSSKNPIARISKDLGHWFDGNTTIKGSLTASNIFAPGGTLSLGSIESFVIKKTSNTQAMIAFLGRTSDSDTTNIKYGYLGINGKNKPVFGEVNKEGTTVTAYHTLLHSGNYSTILDGSYLPLAGGTMNDGAIIKFNKGGLVQTTNTTSNAVTIVLWYKGTDKDDNYSYAAQIGWHNTGDTDGAIYLVPNPQNSNPWEGNVGLYISKTYFRWNSKEIIHAKNYTSYTPILNSASTHATNSSVIYAPSTAGTKNLILISNGSGAPVWTNLSDLSVGSATNWSRSILWTASTTVGSWSRILTILNYANILLSTNWSLNSQASQHLYLICTGHGSAKIVQLGCSNYPGNSTVKIRITKETSLKFHVEVYNSYGYDGATTIPIGCRATNIGTLAVLTTITANTAGSGTEVSSLTSHYNIAKNLHSEWSSNGMFYIAGTGDTAGTWLGSHSEIKSYYTGLTIAYKIPIAGASTTTLNINNLGAKTCYINTSKLTTHYGVGCVAILIYDGTYFRAADYWDGNSYAYVRQYTTDSTNAEYPLLFRYNTAAPTANGYITEYTRYDSGITINPSTNTITAATFNGTAVYIDCVAGSSDTNRPIVLTNTSNKLYYATKATINYSTGNITAPTFTGNLSGNATTATTANVLKATTIVSAKALSLSSATWTDTGYTFASLATGTYAVQVTFGTTLVASGIMSVYKNLADTAGDEIPLHVYGTAGWRPYLRTYDNKLLISSNDASATSRTVTIKIALIL